LISFPAHRAIGKENNIMMRLGTRVSADWIERPDDLRFLKQIGIDYVDIVLDMVRGYNEAGGRANRECLERVVETLDRAGLKIERANTMADDYRNAFLGKPGGEREIENLQVNAELCGQFGFPVMGIQTFPAGTPEERVQIRSWVEGRGGYSHLRIDPSPYRDLPAAATAPDIEDVWAGLLDIYRAVMPVAEQGGVKIAMHGNDPPVPNIFGGPQPMYSFASYDRLFAEVPSPNNGMTFCVGTRYESGEDIFEGIRKYGGQGRIFHVHFRNVRGTLPDRGWYEEVAPDTGDLDMYRVAKALHEVGYEGVIDYDHVMRLATDGPEGRQYIAYCVGHMKGLLQSLESNLSA